MRAILNWAQYKLDLRYAIQLIQLQMSLRFISQRDPKYHKNVTKKLDRKNQFPKYLFSILACVNCRTYQLFSLTDVSSNSSPYLLLNVLIHSCSVIIKTTREILTRNHIETTLFDLLSNFSCMKSKFIRMCPEHE